MVIVYVSTCICLLRKIDVLYCMMMTFKRSPISFKYSSVGPTTDLQATYNRKYNDSSISMHMSKKLTFRYKFVRFHGRCVEVMLNLQSIAFIVSNLQ